MAHATVRSRRALPPAGASLRQASPPMQMPDRRKPPRWLLLGLGLAAALVALLILHDESMRGFPDSHLTDYDRAIQTPRTVLAYLNLVLSAYFAYLGTVGHRSSSLAKAGVAVAVLALLLLLEFILLDLYFLQGLGLDNGRGA
jgi:hypothetical protein